VVHTAPLDAADSGTDDGGADEHPGDHRIARPRNCGGEQWAIGFVRLHQTRQTHAENPGPRQSHPNQQWHAEIRNLGEWQERNADQRHRQRSQHRAATHDGEPVLLYRSTENKGRSLIIIFYEFP